MHLKISRAAPERKKVELEGKWNGRGEPQMMWEKRRKKKKKRVGQRYDRINMVEIRPNRPLIIMNINRSNALHKRQRLSDCRSQN